MQGLGSYSGGHRLFNANYCRTLISAVSISLLSNTGMRQLYSDVSPGRLRAKLKSFDTLDH